MPHIFVDTWSPYWCKTSAPVQICPATWHELSHIVEVEVVSEEFPTGHALEARRTIRLPLRELLVAVGIATSSATNASDLSAWGFLVEHAQSFRATSGTLRTIKGAAEWDSRAKGVFAERVGMGLTAWLLWHEQDIVHIADAEWFIGKSLAESGNPYNGKGLASLGLYGKDGKYKPDYFCLDSASAAVIAESKGALGPPSAVSSAERKKAKEQVKNVDPTGVSLRTSLARLAFATTIRGELDSPNADKDSQVSVTDPDGGPDPIPVKVSPDELVVHSYCKFLQFCGLGGLALLLRAGRVAGVEVEDLDDVTRQVDGRDVVVLADLGGVEFGLVREVFVALFGRRLDGIAERIGRALEQGGPPGQPDTREREHEPTEPETGDDETPAAGGDFILPNGVAAIWNE
ncbi:MAG: hypothetical protein KF729_38570 [Sandaracinaceae bacterium]|nr:hypothetical protein [Sandaracinaceae bacterium]